MQPTTSVAIRVIPTNGAEWTVALFSPPLPDRTGRCGPHSPHRLHKWEGSAHRGAIFSTDNGDPVAWASCPCWVLKNVKDYWNFAPPTRAGCPCHTSLDRRILQIRLEILLLILQRLLQRGDLALE